MCNWILDFLCNRPHTVKIHNRSSNSITSSSTRTPPKGFCILCWMLYALPTHDYVAKHNSSHISQFAYDTTVFMRLPTTIFLSMSARPKRWFADFRRTQISSSSACTSDNFIWSINISSLVNKEQQCLYFLRRLKRTVCALTSSTLSTVVSQRSFWPVASLSSAETDLIQESIAPGVKDCSVNF